MLSILPENSPNLDAKIPFRTITFCCGRLGCGALQMHSSIHVAVGTHRCSEPTGTIGNLIGVLSALQIAHISSVGYSTSV